MPVEVLRCRVCESEYPAIANGICAALLRAARARLRLGRDRARSSRARAIEAGPRVALALRARCCRPTPPDDAASGPGWTPLVPAPRLARALGVGEVC